MVVRVVDDVCYNTSSHFTLLLLLLLLKFHFLAHFFLLIGRFKGIPVSFGNQPTFSLNTFLPAYSQRIIEFLFFIFEVKVQAVCKVVRGSEE